MNTAPAYCADLHAPDADPCLARTCPALAEPGREHCRDCIAGMAEDAAERRRDVRADYERMSADIRAEREAGR